MKLNLLKSRVPAGVMFLLLSLVPNNLFRLMPVVSASPSREVVAYFARPKSRSSTPLDVSMMFPGFRSRWMIPWACAVARASAICAPYCKTLSIGKGRSSDDLPATGPPPVP